jgi:uncharacterized membrane protein
MNTITVFFRTQAVKAWTFTFLMVAGAALLFVAVFAGSNGISFQSSMAMERLRGYTRDFEAAQVVALITPVVALLTAWFAHYGDEHFGGNGIKHIVKKMRPECYNLETDVITGSMTKQSVLAAIASILAGLVLQYDNKTTFGLLIKFLTLCGFGFTILFLLISMVCYDYASRFRWEQFHKAQLARKALLLDVWSWYFLLTSFVLSIALINPRLSVAMCVSAGGTIFSPDHEPGVD